MGETPKKKLDWTGWLKQEVKLKSTPTRNYILQTAISFSTGHYEGAGITLRELQRQIYNSYCYKLSDNPKQQQISQETAYKSIKRTVDILVMRGYLKKLIMDDRTIILATPKAINWLNKQLK